ncbi:hypothetical protein ACO0K3_07515 [Undibacterium sp. Rencai35W]|uniref:hypothetical protein n=1 Tax=unclassified Undibacterium TaxID=2630295 RepID=UPI003BF15037
MKKFVSQAVMGLVLVSGIASVAQAANVDTSVDGIFTALTSSKDLQATVDTLIANGAGAGSVVSVAAAAGISLDTVKDLSICTNDISADSRVLSATCLKPRTVATAYVAGMNDPLKYLPATAAGVRKDKTTK